MIYKACPDCQGVGEYYIYPTQEQPEEYPPCETCDGEGKVIDWKATALDFEQRLAVVEAFVASSQREFRRLGQPGKLEIVPLIENTNDY